MRTADRFIGYIAREELAPGSYRYRFTDWPGNPLGTAFLGRRHPWSRTRVYVSVHDVHGQWWHGVGGVGEYCTLRRCRPQGGVQ